MYRLHIKIRNDTCTYSSGQPTIRRQEMKKFASLLLLAVLTVAIPYTAVAQQKTHLLTEYLSGVYHDKQAPRIQFESYIYYDKKTVAEIVLDPKKIFSLEVHPSNSGFNKVEISLKYLYRTNIEIRDKDGNLPKKVQSWFLYFTFNDWNGDEYYAKDLKAEMGKYEVFLKAQRPIRVVVKREAEYGWIGDDKFEWIDEIHNSFVILSVEELK